MVLQSQKQQKTFVYSQAFFFCVITGAVQSSRWITAAHMAAAVHSCMLGVYCDRLIRLPVVIRLPQPEAQYVLGNS